MTPRVFTSYSAATVLKGGHERDLVLRAFVAGMRKAAEIADAIPTDYDRDAHTLIYVANAIRAAAEEEERRGNEG